jgi:hypothetical protein
VDHAFEEQQRDTERRLAGGEDDGATTFDHQCASQRMMTDPNADVVMNRASAPVSKATPMTEATRNEP